MFDLWNHKYETEGVKYYCLSENKSDQYKLEQCISCAFIEYKGSMNIVTNMIHSNFPKYIISNDKGCDYYHQMKYIIDDEHNINIKLIHPNNVVITKMVTYQNKSLVLALTNHNELAFILDYLKVNLDKKGKNARSINV